jgi:hypothetical protein
VCFSNALPDESGVRSEFPVDASVAAATRRHQFGVKARERGPDQRGNA